MNIDKSNIEVVVFDLYNTLIRVNLEKSDSFFRTIFKLTKDQLNISSTNYYRSILTTDLNELRKTWPEAFEKAIKENAQILSQELISTQAFEETLQALENLSKEFPLFLISNLASPYKQPFFEIGLDQYFEKAFFSCDLGLIKPERAIFELVEKETGKSNSQILMVGDSYSSDIKGAKQLNWRTAFIDRNTISKQKSDKESIKISNLNDLRDKLFQL